ncbi:tryptophan synthase subunit alpha [bacterium]|nr:tryptophan synthase subunit alpha [bacterium]
MERIKAAFARDGAKLIPFVTVGDPSLEATADVVVAMAEAGADLVELGIPYSDPVADGPIIQASSQRALERGTRLADVFGVVRRIRAKSEVPLVLFTYCNPVYRYGLERFMREAAEAGADGVLMPDLPPEEAAELRAEAQRFGLAVIFLVAPTTSDARIALIGEATGGFLYLVAALGVTGVRSEVAANLEGYLRRVRAQTSKPLAVGFGVSTPEQATQIAALGAEAVVVGSALVDRIGRWSHEADLPAKIGAFVGDLKRGVLQARTEGASDLRKI